MGTLSMVRLCMAEVDIKCPLANQSGAVDNLPYFISMIPTQTYNFPLHLCYMSVCI